MLSITETIISLDDVHKLVEMVTQVNGQVVKPEDQLSNNVYEYDSETHSLKIAGNSQVEDEAIDVVQNPDEGQNGPNMAM